MELGTALATVLVGELDGAGSPARRDTDHGGFDLSLQSGRTVVPLRSDFEYAVVVFDGAVLVDGAVVEPGHLGYLSKGRDELAVEAREPTRALIVGGVPFPSPIFMWWNFVSSRKDRIEQAKADWAAQRIGKVPGETEFIPLPMK